MSIGKFNQQQNQMWTKQFFKCEYRLLFWWMIFFSWPGFFLQQFSTIFWLKVWTFDQFIELRPLMSNAKLLFVPKIIIEKWSFCDHETICLCKWWAVRDITVIMPLVLVSHKLCAWWLLNLSGHDNDGKISTIFFQLFKLFIFFFLLFDGVEQSGACI